MSDCGSEHDAISPPQRAAVPRLRVDSPGGQWERENQQTVTAEFEAPVRVPTRWLVTLPGETGEERYLHAAHPHVIEYAQRIAAHGYDEFAATVYGGAPAIVTLEVDHEGETWIFEGNARSRAAHLAGEETIPVHIRFLGGGEKRWSPPPELAHLRDSCRLESERCASEINISRASGLRL